jgi:hypothetical protein
MEQVIEFLQLTEFVAEEEPQHATPSASAIDAFRNRPGPRPDTVKRIYHNTGASPLDHPMISLQSMRSRALLRLLCERLMYPLTRIRSPILRSACRTRAHAQLLVDCYLGCPMQPLPSNVITYNSRAFVCSPVPVAALDEADEANDDESSPALDDPGRERDGTAVSGSGGRGEGRGGSRWGEKARPAPSEAPDTVWIGR